MNNWKTFLLGEFLERQYNTVKIDDFLKYKRITIKTKGLGIELRDEVEGLEIGTKNQFTVKSNQFLLSKIDAMNGAFGIVPDECNGGIITGNFWTYHINEEIVEREYLRLLCIKQVFTKFSNAASEGTTNRKYLREEKFLKLPIQLPSLPEQQQIVSRIEKIETKINQIRKLRAEQEREIGQLLYSKYREVINGARCLPMSEVAPIHRRKVEIDPDKIYHEIGVRSFGRGLFEKASFKGIDLTWQQPYWMKEGDLLFSNIKAWEGAVGLIPKQYDSWVGSHRYITCLPNLKLIEPEFLYYYFKTQEGVEKLKMASPGTADRNRTLNTLKLEKILIPVPDKSLQNEFLGLLNRVEEIKYQHNNTQIELNDLLPSLLNITFPKNF